MAVRDRGGKIFHSQRLPNPHPSPFDGKTLSVKKENVSDVPKAIDLNPGDELRYQSRPSRLFTG